MTLQQSLIRKQEKIFSEIEEKMKEVDILTDFDGTMIKEDSVSMQIYTYFFYKKDNHIGFIKNILKGYINKDIHCFYSLFNGCPIEIIDNIVKKFHQNERWEKLIEELKPKRIGTISRNNKRIILKHLDNLQDKNINLIAANKPEINNNLYTGKAEVIVDNKRLIDLIKGKEYICAREERNILKEFGVYSTKLDKNLYICIKK